MNNLILLLMTLIVSTAFLLMLKIWLSRHKLDVMIAAFEYLPQAIIVTDRKARIIKVNQSFVDITGYSHQDVVGHSPAILSSGKHDQKFYEDMWHRLSQQGEWQGEIWNKRKNGEIYPEKLCIKAVLPLSLKRHRYYVGSFTDITHSKEAEETIERLAYYDSLTHLPNRQHLESKLEQALVSAQQNQTQGAVLFIDLDNFKTLNDTFGHATGDLLLVEVSERIQSILLSPSHTVYRWGGDEFIVLVESLPQDITLATRLARQVAENIRNSLSEVYLLNGLEYFSGSSIGIALFEQDQTVSELLKKADSAMYQAKNAGRNRIYVFNPEMQKAIQRKLELENDLRSAIANGEISLYIQPQVRNDLGVIGGEVLIRWSHPTKGYISPAEFIPLAEQSDLIINLGDWVLEEACRQLSIWQQDAKLSQITLSVNVSGRQLQQHDFVAKVLVILKQNQVEPSRLKMEITESAVMQNLQECIDKMEQLKKYNIEFSMDDFGTGYSSLSNIRVLPLSQLKIDKSFVHNLLEDQGTLKLTKTIIDMCRVLDLDVIAEGVENEDQKNLLTQIECKQFQGFLFSKPMKCLDFPKFAKECCRKRLST